MEQVEGGDLVVNCGDRSRPKATSAEKRELNAVDSLDAAVKLAQVRTPFHCLTSQTCLPASRLSSTR